MAAAGLGRRLVTGVRISSRLVLPASRVGSQSRPWLPLGCCVASTARGYSSTDGSERRFAKSHEWVKLDGTCATIGISDYAQDKLGEVVYVDMPEVGSKLGKGDQLTFLESVKAVAEVYTSLSGTVTEVNSELESSPNLINNHPLGKGWLAKLEVSNKEELNELMTQEQYSQYISESM